MLINGMMATAWANRMSPRRRGPDRRSCVSENIRGFILARVLTRRALRIKAKSKEIDRYTRDNPATSISPESLNITLDVVFADHLAPHAHLVGEELAQHFRPAQGQRDHLNLGD